MAVMKLMFIGSEEGEWFDFGIRTQVKGIISSYQIQHNSIGFHHLTIKASNDKAVISSPLSSQTNNIASQIKSRSLVFQKSDFSNKYYHLISIAYLDNGRLRRKRVKDMIDVPIYIYNHFEIKKHHEVNKAIGHSDKLVGLIEPDDIKSMALAFVSEMIVPIRRFIK
jgi:hypothetical protein